MSLRFIANLLYSQFFITPPYPSHDFTGQTVIVTGSNTGLGFEAAQHFARLNAAKVILAVRTITKGEAAKKKIEENTNKIGVVEVWELELESYESVKQFAEQVRGLKRLDVVVENAGIALKKFRIAEQDEATVTVNVTSTFLLALLLLPKMQETTTKFNVIPRLTIVTSDLHLIAQLKETGADHIFDELNVKERTNMTARYGVTKLLEVFGVRELGKLISASSKPKIILNCITPGACYSDFGRENSKLFSFFLDIAKFILARSTEVGSRTLVAGAEAGEESHGQYMADSKIAAVSPFVTSPEGKITQKRVWTELSEKLERIQPGILENI